MRTRTARRPVTTAAVFIGAALGLILVLLARPEPAGCTTLDNGTRACMPIDVVGPPWWLYLVAALVGALLVGGVARWFGRSRR